MSTLTGIEAERVSQILRHAIDRLHILSYVPTQWDDDLATEITCDPVLASLEKQWIAEDQLRLAVENMAEGGKDVTAVKQAHKATRATCWNLLVERDSLQILMTRSEAQSEEFLKFLRLLTELKAQTNDRMTSTIEEEASNRTILQELVERERLLDESKEAIELKLVEVHNEKSHVTYLLDQSLVKLQLELQEMNSQNTLETDSEQIEMKNVLDRANEEHWKRVKQLELLIEAAEKETSEMEERNNEEEHRLRKDKARAENTLNLKIAQYDEDMYARHTALETLRASYEAESAECAVLEEYFAKIDSDLKMGFEEESLLNAVKKRRQFGINVLNNAAIKIQKIVRGRIGRSQVAKLLAKKKKKKTGGKKKKAT